MGVFCVEKRFGDSENYNRPVTCEKCGGIMIFKGVGEYQCEDCRAVDYDDYGKVRRFLEEHPGATASEAEMSTGVSQKSIRRMLKENKLEISQDSAAFLRCRIFNRVQKVRADETNIAIRLNLIPRISVRTNCLACHRHLRTGFHT